MLQNCSVREIALFDPDVEKVEVQNINRELSQSFEEERHCNY